MYVLKDPKGKLVEWTAAENARDAWVNAYDYVARAVPGYGERYWKRWEGSRRAALRLGYRIVRADLVERT